MPFIISPAVENIAKAGVLLHDCSTIAQEMLHFSAAVRLRLFLPFKIEISIPDEAQV
jgi:hypothetical protein